MSLAIYPLDPSFPRGYVLPRDSRVTVRAADRMAHAKRFTDTELAAEFHASCMDTRVSGGRSRNYPREDLLRDEYVRRLNQEFTLHRFATLPHYDEVTA